MKKYNIIVLVFLAAVVIYLGCPSPDDGEKKKTPTVETPVISPGDTAGFEQDTPVIMNTGSAGAAIYYTYTTDGSDPPDPDETSTLYAGPLPADTFDIGDDVVLKAVGILDGYKNSAVAQVSYSGVRDTLGPVPAMASEYDSTGIVPEEFAITITFNEPVTDFDPADVASFVAVNATVSDTAVWGPDVFEVLVTPTAEDSTITIDIPAGLLTDTVVPTANVASDTFSIYYDSDAPTGTIDSTESTPTIANPIPVTISFDMDVSGFDVADLTVGNGTAANFVAVNAADYTVDIIPDGDGTVTVDIARNVCTAVTGNVPNFASPQFSIIYDLSSPYVESFSPASGGYFNTSDITVTFNEDVYNFDTSDITVNAGGVTPTVTPVSASVYTISLAGLTDTLVEFQITGADIEDAVSNLYTDADTWSSTYDGSNPQVTIDQAGSQADPATTEPVVFTVVFSEPVSGFASGDVTYSGITVASDTVTEIAPMDGTTYSVEASGLGSDGILVATIDADAVVDAAGNGNDASTSTDNSVVYDSNGAPTVTIEQASGQADPSGIADTEIDFTVVFSEPVTGFSDLGVTLSGTALPTTAAVTEIAPNDGTTYNVAVSGMSVDGDVSADVNAAAAQDAAANDNTASTSTDNTVTYDGTAPTVTLLSLAAGSDSGYSGTDNITNVAEPGFTGSTDEAGTLVISSSVDGDVYSGAVGIGAWTEVTASTLDSTGLSGRLHTITATVTDAAGNEGFMTLDITIDTTDPSITADSFTLNAASDTGSITDDNRTNLTTPAFDGEINEAGYLEIDSSVNGNVYAGAVSSDWSNVAITTAITGSATGTSHTMSATIADLAGNLPAAQYDDIDIVVDNAINWKALASSADFLAVTTAASTDISTYTTSESGTASVATGTVTLTDIAGNTANRSVVLDGAGLQTAMTNLGNNDVLFITNGTYQRSAAFTPTNVSWEMIGEGSGTILEVTSTLSSVIFVSGSNSRNYTITNLTVKNSDGFVMIRKVNNNTGTFRLRSITMDTGGTGGTLVMQDSDSDEYVQVWITSDYEDAVPGGGWSWAANVWQFVPPSGDGTYWP